jgi:hypothetical protein
MIDYLYKLDYDENSASDTEVEDNPSQVNSKTTAESNEMVSSSLLHAEVYAMGEKYGIPGLKDLAQRKFEHAVTNGWQDATFCSVVRSVYESTNSNDRGLRDIVTKIACQNAGILKSRQDFLNLIDTLPMFTADLLRETWVQNQESQPLLM